MKRFNLILFRLLLVGWAVGAAGSPVQAVQCSKPYSNGVTINRLGYAWLIAQIQFQPLDGEIFRAIGTPTCVVVDRKDGFRRVAYIKAWNSKSCAVLKFHTNVLVDVYSISCNGSQHIKEGT